MQLEPGSTLGHYEIVAPLGAGGMGEVYRARDPKLDREVAIKVLPEGFAESEERLARFEREAKSLAALNHPNIATIFGFEQDGDTHFLVMELVEGEDLSERIARGPIPVDEVIPLFVQVAEGLEAAHEKGIIHRDLKPANLMVSAEGRVKILDFGLAKAMEPPASASGDVDLSQSPTMTAAATMRGEIMGTAAYMSPEQAKGRPVDKRADVWAFGCVLFEALTGQRAFAGEDAPDTLAAVLRAEIDLEALPLAVPAGLRRLLERCLRRDKAQRLRDIGDARLEFEDVLAAENEEKVAEPAPRRGLPATWSLAGMAASAAFAAVAVWLLRAEPDPRASVRFSFEEPSVAFQEGSALDPGVAVSPDGKTIAFQSVDGGTPRIHLRSLERIETLPVRGTEGGIWPRFSPDGEWLLFTVGGVDGEVRKVPVTGGSSTTLQSSGATGGYEWTSEGRILKGSDDGLFEIPSAGGEPKQLLQSGQILAPTLLPGGQEVLFFTGGVGGEPAVHVASLESGDVRTLIPGSSPKLTTSGHLVFARDGSLWAAAFDSERAKLTGDPVPIVEGVKVNFPGFANFALGGATLAYVRAYGSEEHLRGPTEVLVWVDREGREEELQAPPRAYEYPRLSPEGDRVGAFSRYEDWDLWVWHLPEGPLDPLTSGPAQEPYLVWLPGGREVIFSSSRAARRPGRLGAVMNLYRQAADGTGEPMRIAASEERQVPEALSPDGKQLVFRFGYPEHDLWLLSLVDGAEPQALIATAAEERHAAISPDGRWLAYSSNESGQYQVYVRPFPNVDEGRVPVSTTGGESPVWSLDGRELFYRVRGSLSRMMAVSVGVEDGRFVASRPELLFEGDYLFGEIGRNYDVTADGRFLMVKQVESVSRDGDRREIVVVSNWTEELERALGPSER